MRLFTPFTIPKKENCDLCRIEKNKKKTVENHLLDNLFKNWVNAEARSWRALTSAIPLWL